MKDNKLKKIIIFIILGVLAFFSSNALLHQITGKNISLLGTLFSIPTFFLYLYIHTSLFRKKQKR